MNQFVDDMMAELDKAGIPAAKTVTTDPMCEDDEIAIIGTRYTIQCGSEHYYGVLTEESKEGFTMFDDTETVDPKKLIEALKKKMGAA